MTCILYGPGMFGSTLEYVLSTFRSDHGLDANAICADGSLHSFKKSAHVWQESDFALLDDLDKQSVATVIYPNNTQKFAQIVQCLPQQHQEKNIVIYSENRRSSERNLLFQYYKISLGDSPEHQSQGLSNFSTNADFSKWNSEYTSWQDMQPWEWREWFSYFYPGLCAEWESVQSNWLMIDCDFVLENFEKAVSRICSYLDIALTSAQLDNLDRFSEIWKKKQQYIVDEYQTVENILQSLNNDSYYAWDQISPLSEAFVQNRLRQQGIEIQCQDLNVFPTNTSDLQKVLEHAIL